MINGRQCAAARIWMGLSQVDMCGKAGLYRQKLIAFERGGAIDAVALSGIEDVLISGGARINRNGSITLDP